MNGNLGHEAAQEVFVFFFGSGWLLCAAPGILLCDDELQDEPGCPAGLLHGHRVAAVLQKVYLASRQHVCDDRGTGHVYHLSKQQTILPLVPIWSSCVQTMNGLCIISSVAFRSYTTWSCFPHITCRGAVIRCKCSCKAYLEFSLKISINTAWKSGESVS